MDDAASPRLPLVGIRSRKASRPDPSAVPEISVVVLEATAVPVVIGALEEAAYPFEILIAAADDAGHDPSFLPPGDPRVRVMRIDRHGAGEILRLAAETTRAEFVLPLFPASAIAPGQVRTLREAMDSWSAYSYLPGEPAADVALIARASSALRSATMYALLGLYAGDLRGPIMIRRSRLLTLHAATDPPSTLVEIAVKVKREGGVVRIVRAPAAPGPALSLLSAIRLRAAIRKASS